jgi:hypothetical protein
MIQDELHNQADRLRVPQLTIAPRSHHIAPPALHNALHPCYSQHSQLPNSCRSLFLCSRRCAVRILNETPTRQNHLPTGKQLMVFWPPLQLPLSTAQEYSTGPGTGATTSSLPIAAPEINQPTNQIPTGKFTKPQPQTQNLPLCVATMPPTTHFHHTCHVGLPPYAAQQ